ncbi:MAG: hypothetical protein ABIN79_08000 [Marmoricola sp.]
MAPITGPFRFWRRSTAVRPTTRRHLQTAVSVRTLDERTARVLVGFTRETLLPESFPHTSDAIAIDAVDNALRTHLETLDSTELPQPHQRLREVEQLLEAHEVIDNVFALTCDVAVTEQARELVAS